MINQLINSGKWNRSTATAYLLPVVCILAVTVMTFAIQNFASRPFSTGRREQPDVGADRNRLHAAFWGFTLAMVIGGILVDALGMKRIVWGAFFTHAVGILATLLATDFWTLFFRHPTIGIGNGFVEAALNPLVASVYKEDKTKMLNRFHVWFPGGIVIGSVMGYLVMDVFGLSWHLMVAVLFIPLVIYGMMFWGSRSPYGAGGNGHYHR